MWNKIIYYLFKFTIDKIVNNTLESKLTELKQLERELIQTELALKEKLNSSGLLPTTIRSFVGLNKEYYNFVVQLKASEEFKYLMFDLRENIIREMIGTKDEKDLIKYTGRLELINIIHNYLTEYKKNYETQIQRTKKNTER